MVVLRPHEHPRERHLRPAPCAPPPLIYFSVRMKATRALISSAESLPLYAGILPLPSGPWQVAHLAWYTAAPSAAKAASGASIIATITSSSTVRFMVQILPFVEENLNRERSWAHDVGHGSYVFAVTSPHSPSDTRDPSKLEIRRAAPSRLRSPRAAGRAPHRRSILRSVTCSTRRSAFLSADTPPRLRRAPAGCAARRGCARRRRSRRRGRR